MAREDQGQDWNMDGADCFHYWRLGLLALPRWGTDDRWRLVFKRGPVTILAGLPLNYSAPVGQSDCRN